MFLEGDDLVCLACGDRQVDAVSGNGYEAEGDPFVNLIRVMAETADALRRAERATAATLVKQRAQLKVIDKALRALQPAKARSEVKAPKCEVCGDFFVSKVDKAHRLAEASA